MLLSPDDISVYKKGGKNKFVSGVEFATSSPCQ